MNPPRGRGRGRGRGRLGPLRRPSSYYRNASFLGRDHECNRDRGSDHERGSDLDFEGGR